MNIDILNQYSIIFKKVIIDGDATLICEQIIISDISYCLCGYFNKQPYVEFFEEELLIDIEKAIQNQPFDPDGGGDGVYLEIGYPNSTFTSGGGAFKITPTIPTEDLKKIILSWVEFLNNNS